MRLLELHCIDPWIWEQMIRALVPSLLFTCCTAVWTVVRISFFLEETKPSFLHTKLPFSRLLRSRSLEMYLSKVTKITLSIFFNFLFQFTETEIMVTAVLLPGEMLFNRPVLWAYCGTWAPRSGLRTLGWWIVWDEALQAGYGVCPDYWSNLWKELSDSLSLWVSFRMAAISS